MTMRDDEDRFRVKPGPPRVRGKAPKSKFVSRVLKQTSRAGRTIGRTLPTSRPAKGKKSFGRGQVAAKLAGRSLTARSRRVTIKTRTVRLQKASPRSVEKHLDYIQRDSATRHGEPGRLFSAHSNEADAAEFAERSKGDRHQFRMIVSPEDGAQLGDLKAFARDLMSQVERDLGTRLEWVAADHWDTDQPHVHITLRGKEESGRDLVISQDYIVQGMRDRASELATRWLGPRTELEIRESLTREVSQERWTSLDRTIVSQSVDGRIVVRSQASNAEARFRAGLLIGRLDHLTSLGIATKTKPFTYILDPNMEPVLRALGERGDIIRTMQHAMGGTRREFSIFDPVQASGRIVGRVAGKGLVDELSDRGYFVVDGIDGRAHHVKLSGRMDLNDFPVGGIVEVRGGGEPNRADINIAKIATDGVYRVDRHLRAAFEQLPPGTDPDALVQSHVRRLEALRRSNIVRRVEQGVWSIPPDFLARAQAYNAQRMDGANVELRSHLPLAQQISATGATWLDQQLVGRRDGLGAQGFGSDTRAALAKRTEVLLERNLAERRGRQVVFARNLLDRLCSQEIADAARNLEAQTGLTHRPVQEGRRVSGIYRRSVLLLSGRFAMLDDATGFSLVPWRPVIEPRLGQPMSVVVRGNFTAFDFGRKRDLTL